MRCDDFQNLIIEGQVEGQVAEHLAHCPTCREFARDYELLRTGLRVLAAEPAPEPSWGFAARLLRQLAAASEGERREKEFFERVGRRVVYVASLVALVIVLALALPTSGPFRGPTTAEFTLAQSENGSAINPLFADEIAASQDVSILPVWMEGGTNER